MRYNASSSTVRPGSTFRPSSTIRPGGRTALSLATLLALLVCAAAFADLTAEPSSVTFKSLKQSFAIKLASGGKPVAAGDIVGWRFMATGHDYKHMLKCQKKNGELVVAASDTMEVGSYDLIIKTKSGSVTVKVEAPLNEQKDIVDTTAAELNGSKEEAKKELGLSTVGARAKVKIDLPAQFLVGQKAEIEMPRAATRVYTWSINGKPVLSGAGENKFSYTFKSPGDYELTYTEQENGVVVATTKAKTKAVPPPEPPKK